MLQIRTANENDASACSTILTRSIQKLCGPDAQQNAKIRPHSEIY